MGRSRCSLAGCTEDTLQEALESASCAWWSHYVRCSHRESIKKAKSERRCSHCEQESRAASSSLPTPIQSEGFALVASCGSCRSCLSLPRVSGAHWTFHR